MLKINEKISTNKYLLLSLLVICLTFTSMGFNIENSYASDVSYSNETVSVNVSVSENVNHYYVNDEILTSYCDSENLSSISNGENFDEFLSMDAIDKNISNTSNKDNFNEFLSINDDAKTLDGFSNSGDDCENLFTTKDIGDLDEKLSIVNVENENEILKDEIYRTTYGIYGGYFDILYYGFGGNFATNAILNYWESGKYREGDSTLVITRPFIFTSPAFVTLDALNQISLFKLEEGAAGMVISNFTICNAVGSTGSAIEICASNVLIENCIFLNNHCDYGGIISIAENVTNVTIRNCTFINNTASHGNFTGVGSIAALGIFGSNCTVEGCTFDTNWVDGVDDAYATAIGVGDNSQGIIIKDTVFKNNYASIIDSDTYGAAITINHDVNITNCTFINNTASYGGAVMFYKDFNLTNCSFINNTAFYCGGALFTSENITLNINNSIFDGNKAKKGGAIYANCANLTINNSIFLNNNADYGGAISIECENVTIDNSNFISNYAEINGGAIFINAAGCKILNSTFDSNIANINNGLGGAIYINSSNVIIESSHFKLNKAMNGSAIYVDKKSQKVSISKTTFKTNKAQAYALSIQAEDIYYDETEHINMTVKGGNNIIDYSNSLISNAIYSATNNEELEIDGKNPVEGVTMSGLFRGEVAFNTTVLLTLIHEDGTVEYNNTAYSDYYGALYVNINYIRPGRYTAIASGGDDSNYVNLVNTTSFEVYAKVDPQIIIFTNVTEYRYADIITFSLNITNWGLNDASDVIVNYILPNTIIYLNDDSQGAYNPETGIVTIDKIKVNEEIIINISAKINQIGDYNLKANVSTVELDTNVTNNYDEITFTVNQSADVSISIESNCSNANYHDLINWTITVKNNGPCVAHHVKIYDLITNTLIPTDFTEGYDLKTSSWEIDTLEVGGEVVYNLITKINTTGEIINNLAIDCYEYDFNATNNIVNRSINVYPTSDLSVNISVNSSSLNYLDYVKLTLKITNNGLDNATNVVVNNVLPDGFIYLNSTMIYENNGFNIGNLSKDCEVVIDIDCMINTTGTYINYASIVGYEFDYDLSNNEYGKELIIFPSAELEITESVTNLNPNFYDLINWTITVTNNGPDIANNVVVNDLISNSLIYICDSSDNDYDNASGIWSIKSISVGESVNLTITCRVMNSGSIINNINCSSDEYDYYMENNYDSLEIKVNSSSDLAITIDVNSSYLNYRDYVKWILTIKNNGVDKATNVKVVEILPERFIYLNSTLEYWHNTFDIGNLSAGEEIKIEINCIINTTGNYNHYVNITCDEYDFNLTNNEYVQPILVHNASNLKITHNISNLKPNFNDLINITITVTNDGPNNAVDVNVYDMLPDSLIYLGDDSLNNYNPIVGLWKVGNLDINSTASLTIKCRVNKTGKYENNVNITCELYDYDLNDNREHSQIEISNASDLSIISLLNATTINYDDLVKLTLVIKNNGINNASIIRIFNVIPEGFIFTDNILTYTNGVIFIDKLEINQEKTIEINLKANKTGEFRLSSSITSIEYDYNLKNNNASSVVYVNPVADLGVVCEVNTLNPAFDDVIDLMVNITNYGLDVADGVVVNLSVPDYLLCLNDSFGGALNVGSLDVGCSFSFNVNYKVNGTGLFGIGVNVSSQVFDYDLNNNYDDIYFTVNQTSDLTLIGSVNVSNLNYGDLVALTLTVVNNGLNDAYNVSVSVSIPEGFIVVSSNLRLIDYLRVDESKDIVIILKANSTGNFTFISNVNSTAFDINLENNNVSNMVYVNPTADLEISQNILNDISIDYVNLTIKVKNNGIDKAENVVVNEIIPKSLTYIDDDSKGAYDYLKGIWTIEKIDSGEEFTLTILCKVNKAETLINSVNVTSQTFDYNLNNNINTTSINVGISTDLEIKTQINTSAINYGDLVTLVLTVENKGNNDASNIKIVNTLPTAFEYVDSILKYTNGIFFIDHLSINQKTSLNIIVKANAVGNYTNHVNVESSEIDSNKSNNINSISLNVNPASDLEINTYVNVTNAKYGDLVNLTIIIKNNGPSFASNVVVNNLITNSLIYVNDTSSGKYNPVTGIWNVGDLKNNENNVLNIIYKINNTGEIINNINVTSHVFDYDYENNHDSNKIIVESASDLTIISNINNTHVNYFDLVKLTLTIINNGLNDAHNIKIENNIPYGLEYINSTHHCENGIINIENLKSNEKLNIDIIFQITDVSNYTITSNVTGDEFDFNITNNNDSSYINVNMASDLEIHQTFIRLNHNYQDVINWTITVKNNGPNTAFNVVVYDLIPSSLITLDSFSGVWKIGDLDVGEIRNLTVFAMINSTGLIVNNVNVSSDNYDYDLINNYDSFSIEINSSSDLEILALMDTTEINYGDYINVTLVVSNNGINDADNINISFDSLKGLVLVNSTLNNINKLGIGEKITYKLTYKVNTTGNYNICYNISSDIFDHNLENNNALLSIKINPMADLGISSIVSDENPNYHDSINISISIWNNGYDTAHNVIVHDLIPSSLIVMDSFDGIWYVGNLSAGEVRNLTVLCCVNSTGLIVNTVNVSANEFDCDLSNNYNTNFINVNSSCDLEILALINGTDVNYGDYVNVTLVVLNKGLDNSIVNVSFNTPEGLLLVNSTLDNLGVISAGEKLIYNLIYLVNTTGNYSLLYNISSDIYDYDLNNNNCSISININPMADLEVITTFDNIAVNYHDLVNLTVVVCNRGLDVAHNVVVCDMIPSSLVMFTSFDGIWNVGDLGVGEVRNLTVLCCVNSTGLIVNTVNVSADEFDYNIENNNASSSIDIDSTSDLGIIALINTTNINYGDYIKLTFIVTNYGFDDANNVFIEIGMPQNLIYINSTFNYIEDLINVGKIKCGENKTVEMVYKVDGVGNFLISSKVDSNNDDYNLDNNENTILFAVNPVCDLKITTSINTTNINYNDIINLTVYVSNVGLSDANNITVENSLFNNFTYINSTFKWIDGIINIDKLAAGDELTINVIFKANTTGNCSSYTNVSCEVYDYNLTNNYDLIDINVNPASDLEIITNITTLNLKYGDLINWTVTIRNNGPDTAHNILIQDIIPNMLSKVNLIGNYEFEDGLCEIESLNVGQEIQFNIVGVIDTTGIIENKINVTGFEYDYNKLNNYNVNTINIDLTSDLIIQSIINTTDVNYRDYVKLTLIITNAGPDDADNVQIHMVLPDEVTYINSSLNFSNNTFKLGSLANGEIINIDVIAKINSTGNYTIFANITTTIYDNYLDNNNCSLQININDAADLEINNVANTTNSKFGDVINWTIKVKNNGVNTAFDVIVNNTLSNSLIYMEDNSNGNYSPQTGIWHINKLEVGEESTLNIKTKVNKTGTIVNHVDVISPIFDYNLTNNEYDAIVNIEDVVDISVVMSANNTNPIHGDIIKLTLTALNNGSVKASNVKVQISNSNNLMYINSSQTKGHYEELMWIIGDIDVGQTETLELTYKVDSVGIISSNVEIKADEYDINSTNNKYELELNSSKNIDLVIEQNINSQTLVIGENITLSIIVSNFGLDNASDIKLKTVLSKSLILINYTISKGEYLNDVWNIGNINVNSSEYLNITYNVNQTGLINNTVTILSDNLNNTLEFNVNAIVDVTIKETVNNTNPHLGDTIKLTITVSNNGISKANNVIIQKQLPEGLVVINTTISKGTYSDNQWFECCLEKGEVQTLEMICNVTKSGLIFYNVSITSNEDDIDLTNNNDSILLNVTAVNTNSTKSQVNNVVVKKDNNNYVIDVKKLTKVKKSSKLTKVKITLRGKKITVKKSIKFKSNGKNKIKVKIGKSLKGKKVTVNFKGKNYKVKVNKKGILTIKTSKKLKKGKTYGSVVSWNSFKVYKNKKLTIKFKGKNYNVKTNKNGVATFKITKKMTKDIKKGKTVKYAIYYNNINVNKYLRIV